MRRALRDNVQENLKAELRRQAQMEAYEVRRAAQRMVARNMRIEFHAPEVIRLLNEWAGGSKRDFRELIAKKARDLSIKLYQEFAVYTPSREKIRQDCEAALASGRGLRVRERAKGSPRVVVSRFGKINWGQTVIASEIRERQIHRFATSGTWLFKRWRPSPNEKGRKLVNNLEPGASRKGGTASVVIYQFDGDHPFIEFRNSVPGVVEQQNRHGIIERALGRMAIELHADLAARARRQAEFFNRRNASTMGFIGKRALGNLFFH